MTEFERLISRLSDLGYKPENMAITKDNSSKSHYDNEDEYWWIIETLFDKILELEEYKSMYEGLCK